MKIEGKSLGLAALIWLCVFVFSFLFLVPPGVPVEDGKGPRPEETELCPGRRYWSHCTVEEKWESRGRMLTALPFLLMVTPLIPFTLAGPIMDIEDLLWRCVYLFFTPWIGIPFLYGLLLLAQKIKKKLSS